VNFTRIEGKLAAGNEVRVINAMGRDVVSSEYLLFYIPL
jgi:hypothetical protein